MKYFKLKHPVSFPITACWGITATKYAVIIYLGLRGFVIELQQRKLTKRPPDAGKSSVRIGYLTPEEDAAIKADNTPAQRR